MTDGKPRSHGMFQPRPTARPKPLTEDQAPAHAFRIKVLTIFPELFPGPLAASLTGKALTEGLWALETIDLRPFGIGKHRNVDDSPAGGGAGMVLRADVVAGLTVAIVALPLSMAIAIASGVGPERGLFTAIVGGFIVSLLGGSRFQIGGPAGAFIVGVSACVAQIGVPGLMVATFLSGFILMAAGGLKLGSYVKFLPYPVTIGFTSGIAVIIFSSQIKELLGLHLVGAENRTV